LHSNFMVRMIHRNKRQTKMFIYYFEKDTTNDPMTLMSIIILSFFPD
jgi:hypothetical protein